MLEHVVVFKMKSDATDQQADELVRRLRGLKDAIPEIVALSAGRHIEARPDGFTIGIVVRFRDEAGLEAYRPHPEHQKVVAYINEVCADRIAVDYWI
ncbi:MAG TPA: Dabb family protein [Limnochordia bacterium]|nr:Dabb family protein [Limnochordia bacterium]